MLIFFISTFINYKWQFIISSKSKAELWRVLWFHLVFFKKTILASTSDPKVRSWSLFPAGLASQAKDTEVDRSHTRGSSKASEVSKSSFSGVVLSRIELKQFMRGTMISELLKQLNICSRLSTCPGQIGQKGDPDFPSLVGKILWIVLNRIFNYPFSSLI